jgi:hypothetical protein
VHQLYGTAANW